MMIRKWLAGLFGDSDPYYNWALVFGAIAVIVLFCTIPPVIKTSEDVNKIEAFRFYFFALSAITTFLTIAWRGRISERQIRGTEEKNLAELFQKGVEHISEESSAKQMAGIVSLGAVASDPNGKFAVQALNILADYLQNNFKDHHEDDRCRAAVEALRNGGAASQTSGLHRVAARELKFDAGDKKYALWLAVTGVKRVNYSGGTFKIDESNPLSFFENSGTFAQFKDVRFSHCDFNFDFFAENCDFQECQIKIFYLYSMKDHTFDRCDFSDCIFDGASPLPDLRTGGNYFLPGHPPKADFDVKWEDILHVGKPKIP